MRNRRYISGDWLFVCDECGFTYRGSQGRTQWNELFVCPMCSETRHPQDYVRGVKDDMRAPKVRSRAYPNYKFVS
jgi:rubredoxin